MGGNYYNVISKRYVGITVGDNYFAVSDYTGNKTVLLYFKLSERTIVYTFLLFCTKFYCLNLSVYKSVEKDKRLNPLHLGNNEDIKFLG